MATYWLLNNITLSGGMMYAGTKVNSAYDDTTAIANAGGILHVTGDSILDTAAADAQSLRLKGGDPAAMEALMSAAYDKLLGSTGAGAGASEIAIEDSGLLYTATNVEAALAEVKALADAAIALGKRTVTVTHADLTEAVNGTAQLINIGAALPADAIVLGSEVNIATLFSGGGATAVKLDIGGTDDDAIAAQHDVFTGANTGALTPTPAGVHREGKFSSQQLKAKFTPDAGHSLLNLTAGDLTITVWYSILA